MEKRKSRKERHAARGIKTPALPPLQPRYPEIVTADQETYIALLLEVRLAHTKARERDYRLLELNQTLLVLIEAEIMLSQRMLKLLTT